MWQIKLPWREIDGENTENNSWRGKLVSFVYSSSNCRIIKEECPAERARQASSFVCSVVYLSLCIVMNLMNLTLPFHAWQDWNLLLSLAQAKQPHSSPVRAIKSLQLIGNAQSVSFAARIISRKYRRKIFQKAGNKTKWHFCLFLPSVVKEHRKAENISAPLANILSTLDLIVILNCLVKKQADSQLLN